jgi:hypothetical protein
MVELPLLDALALRMGCGYLSDLRGLSDVDRVKLAQLLWQLEPECATLTEWNSVLTYLTGEPPEPTRWRARRRLLCLLSRPR